MPQSISPDIIRICKICGNEFHPKARKQKCCGQVRIKQCAYCGKDFEYVCNPDGNKMTCSVSCQAAYIKEKRMKSASQLKKICKWCGKEFMPKSARDAYCRDVHYQTCEVCGKQFIIDVRTDPYVKTCSDECRYKLMVSKQDRETMVEHQKQTMLERYGVENPMQLSESVEKIKATNKEKYGTEWYMQTDEYKERVKETCLEKYGVEHHLQSKEVQAQIAATVKERYGVDNVSKNPEIQQKIKDALTERYGVSNISMLPEIQQQIVANNYAKYGVKHPMMLKEFQDKAAQTNVERYGRKAYTQQHIENIQNWYEFIDDPEGYIKSHYDEKPRVEKLAEDLGVDNSTVDVYLERHLARHCVKRARSLMELELQDFMLSLDPSLSVIHNARKVVGGHDELDLYMPDLDFAIECNPTCTHNSSAADPWGGEPKSYSYHLHKTKVAQEHGIFLFHIFGYEWTHKRSIIESMIRNILGKNENVIYARKCIVKEVPAIEAYQFLEDNHRQGGAQSSIRLGLYYNDNLVSLMTFGKMRNSIGTGKENLENTYELVRFCSVLNTTVVGAASKLFKYFLKEHQPEAVRSFSDRAHTRGKLYQNLGFKEVRRSDAGYVWVNVVTDVAYHRVNAQKKNLKAFLKDDSIDLSKTEKQIMEEHGFVQVFDSGTITWEWRKE